MELNVRQMILEEGAVTRGLERYWTDVKANRERDREYDGGTGRSFTTEIMEQFIPVVQGLQRDARKRWTAHLTSGRRLSGWEVPICALSAPELAYITVRTALSTRTSHCNTHQLGKLVGLRCNLQLNWAEARLQERDKTREDTNHRNRVYLLKLHRNLSPRSVRTWLRRLEDLHYSEWPHDSRLRLGVVLVNNLVDSCRDTFDYTSIWQVHSATR